MEWLDIVLAANPSILGTEALILAFIVGYKCKLGFVRGIGAAVTVIVQSACVWCFGNTLSAFTVVIFLLCQFITIGAIVYFWKNSDRIYEEHHNKKR